ncbi:hypothetical protein MGSAQ_002453, partial [marine sediment metagenome]
QFIPFNYYDAFNFVVPFKHDR